MLGADTRPLIEKTLQDTKETFLHGLRDKGIRYQSQPVNAGSFSVTLTGLNADADKASEVAASLARGSTGEKQFDVTRDQQHITFTITEEYKASLASDAIAPRRQVRVLRSRRPKRPRFHTCSLSDRRRCCRRAETREVL